MILDFQLELKSLAESFRADQELHEGKAPQPTEVASLVEDTEEQVRSLELELVILSEESLTFQQKAEQMLATLTAEKGICESALSHARGQNAQLMEELQHYKSAQTSINSKLEARNQDFIPANFSAAERSGDSSAFSNGHAQRTTSPGGHAMNPATPPVDAEKSTRELYVKLTAANEEIAALQSSLAQQEREGARAASNAELLRSELARKEEQLRDATEQVVSLRLEQARNRDTPAAHAPAANTPTPHMPDPSTVSQIQESLAQLEEEFRSVQHFFALDHNPPLALGKVAARTSRGWEVCGLSAASSMGLTSACAVLCGAERGAVRCGAMLCCVSLSASRLCLLSLSQSRSVSVSVSDSVSSLTLSLSLCAVPGRQSGLTTLPLQPPAPHLPEPPIEHSVFDAEHQLPLSAACWTPSFQTTSHGVDWPWSMKSDGTKRKGSSLGCLAVNPHTLSTSPSSCPLLLLMPGSCPGSP